MYVFYTYIYIYMYIYEASLRAAAPPIHLSGVRA